MRHNPRPPPPPSRRTQVQKAGHVEHALGSHVCRFACEVPCVNEPLGLHTPLRPPHLPAPACVPRLTTRPFAFPALPYRVCSLLQETHAPLGSQTLFPASAPGLLPGRAQLCLTCPGGASPSPSRLFWRGRFQAPGPLRRRGAKKPLNVRGQGSSFRRPCGMRTNGRGHLSVMCAGKH